MAGRKRPTEVLLARGPVQVLYFEDIASISDPCERFSEEAKRQEILYSWPGVKYAEYNSIGIVE